MRVGDATEASPCASISRAEDGDPVHSTLWREAVDVWLRQVAFVDKARLAQPVTPTVVKEPLPTEHHLAV